MSKKRAVVGGVYAIKLSKGYIYGRLLNEGMSFYEYLTPEKESDLDLILIQKEFYRNGVHREFIKNGKWEFVGSRPLEGRFLKNPQYYLPDPTDDDNFRIYDNGQIRGATREECMGLELLTVWDPEIIEEILEAHFVKGEESKWLISRRDLMIK